MPHRAETVSDGHEGPDLEPIAICGMASRLPGGVDSDSSFWRMLVEKRSGQTPKVPKSRFNIDAHYHQSPDRPGSFNVAGGYFLDGRPEDFDPTFFNITPVEAQWLDPQQRKMLEVCYESLVSAGVTLDAIAGSSTAVFVGSFTSDYQQMSIRDPDFRHNYAATGVDPGIISNRIGNTFNLKGPSFTINTACSSSIYALHNACHGLRSHDCDAAIVGGVNLILTVDQHMNTAKLGILSPTSTCHTFDESADGYGRAEGAGALFVKRLKDAIQDGNPVRGVIRSTAVNTNGKIEGVGITHPSAGGQERVVRIAYERANLDPNLTAYAELHGTGTPVGDPIEVKAISRALNDTRPKDRPLLIGAVKPNIGHSEAASGIFAVMKASLMTEAALIPGVAFFNKLNPEIMEEDWNVKVHADTAPWPKDSVVRRASVSSFGYGGTNGHVIIESIDNLYPWYKHAKAKKDASSDRSSKKPFLLCVSAHDRATLSRNVKAIGSVAANYFLVDLAHTLNLHRTMFSHRAFTVAYEGREAEAFAPNVIQSGMASRKSTGVGFLFTGQGAQWAGMAREALKEFPSFRDTIQKLDLCLSRLSPKPHFNMAEMILGEDESTARRINEADVTQPLCTAIQIALVDLFGQWGIEPEVSVGHSSGEIGAAYAAGLISAAEAILAAFCRGRAVAERASSGSMLAVGLGAEEIQQYLLLTPDDVCIACDNSPSSVTLSGTAKSIAGLQVSLSAKGIFARELKTGKAYHSPHMIPVSAEYDTMLREARQTLTTEDLLWRRPRSQMISSVIGELIAEDNLPADYWSTNLQQRVLFKKAIQQLISHEGLSHVQLVVEVGPHSALSGPFKQICLAHDLNHYTYIPSLVRNKNDAVQVLSVAGSLFLGGYPTDLRSVNSSTASDNNAQRKPLTQHLLVDLPPYQWNYEKQYWAEPRASAEQRARIYPRHDILGSRVSGLTTHAQAWCNVLRQRDVPWLKDHNLGGTTIFPAAGHLSMAIEALRQVYENEGRAFDGVTLRDVDIKTALVIPDSNDGIESFVRIQRPTDDSDWWPFAVESLTDGLWQLHCEGRISASHRSDGSKESPVTESALTQRVSSKRWYNAFDRVGFYYGKSFQQLQSTRTDRSVRHATGDITILEECGIMQGESRYLIHPSTIDACLQLIIISIHSGKHKEMPWGVVPTRIEEISLWPARQAAHSTGHAVAWTDEYSERKFNTNVHLRGPAGQLLLDIRNLTCITYDAAIPAGTLETRTEPEPFSTVIWEPDIKSLPFDGLERLWPSLETERDRLIKLVELAHHRAPIDSAIIFGSPSSETVDAVLRLLPDTTKITLGFDGEQKTSISDKAEARTTVKNFPSTSEDWTQASDGSHDLILVDYSSQQDLNHYNALLPLIKDGGWLLGSSTGAAPLLRGSSRLGQVFAFCKSEAATNRAILNGNTPDDKHQDRVARSNMISKGSSSHGKMLNGVDSNGSFPDGPIHDEMVLNGTIPHSEDIAILSLEDSQDLRDSVSSISFDHTIHADSIKSFSPNKQFGVVIDDRAGTMFSSMSSDASIFEAVKKVLISGIRALWLTQGVKQGSSATGGMAEGLLRAIRSEQAAARIVLLDVDSSETPHDVSRAIINKLQTAETKDTGQDTEFWLHKGVLHVARVQPQKSLNRKKGHAIAEVLTEDVPLSATVAEGQLAFKQDTQQPFIADDEIEVQVLASQLPSSTSRLQSLVCGTVIRVGSSVDQSLKGGRAVAFANHMFDTIVRTSTYAITNEHANSPPEQLVRTLSALYPVVNLCLLNTNLAQGDYIMSLPGSNAFNGMIRRLAKAKGWRLDIIAGPNQGREQSAAETGFDPHQVYLSGDLETVVASVQERCKKSRSGTTTIIAHDFSKLSREVWRRIPPSCRFLLNETSADVAPDPLPFSRGAVFISTSLQAASSYRKIELLERSIEALNMYQELSADLCGLAKVLDIADAEESFFHPEPQSEPAVARFCYGQSRVKTFPKEKQLRFSPDATYLLVGCLGGLGRSLTRWMHECGAKHFAFLSRNGTDKPEAAHLVDILESSGAMPQVIRADAADEVAVRRIVVELNTTRPIRGVVHAATILKDGMFEQMDYPSFADSVNPKARGALSLHNAVQGLDLDFFVMTSSISALLGNTGQSNYSAANSVLDALALQRNTSHLVGTSLVLPMVLGVGIVAENESIELSLARKGLYGIDELEMLHGFELAMSQTTSSRVDGSTNSQIIMGMEARELARSMASVENLDVYWYNDARFCHVRAALTGGEGQPGGKEQDSFVTKVKEATAEGPEAVLSVIATHIAKRMSAILMISVDDFELNGPSLGSYGLDSMIGAEMRTWIFKEFGLDYPFQKLLAPTLTFIKLAGVVAEQMGLLSTV